MNSVFRGISSCQEVVARHYLYLDSIYHIVDYSDFIWSSYLTSQRICANITTRFHQEFQSEFDGPSDATEKFPQHTHG